MKLSDLLDVVYAHDELADLDPAARRLALRSLLADSVAAGELPEAVAQVSDAIDGFGPLSPLMADPEVTDVIVNGPSEVWVERGGSLQATAVRFPSVDLLYAFVERMLGEAGRRVDASCPLADARLPDGSRIHVAIPPVAPAGPLVSIRRFGGPGPSLAGLVLAGSIDRETAAALEDLVVTRTSLAICGATGSGKTTLLNALLGLVPPGERVVTIEETPELRPACGHVASLVCREPNVEGRGGIALRDLVRAALRMRPDRIVVGEVRGGEMIDALAALSTGHAGSMLTVHARSCADAIDRMVALALQAGGGASESSLHDQVTAAFGAIVHVIKDPSGRRRIGQIIRITGGSATGRIVGVA